MATVTVIKQPVYGLPGLVIPNAVNRVRYPSPPGATYTASSQFSASYVPANAADGVFADPGEWAQTAHPDGGWWMCTWTYPQLIRKIITFGRLSDQMGVCRIDFSDGSSVPVAGIQIARRGCVTVFTPRCVTSFTIITISGANGYAGYSEVEAY